jgi:large subunit ribosomal protein L10
MSKPIKALLRKELEHRLSGLTSFAVISLCGVDGVQTNQLRRDFSAKQVRITVVKNSVAKSALKELGLSAAEGLLDGPCALVTGGDNVVSVVRDLLARNKDIKAMKVCGALMDGDVFPAAKVEELSKYPTRIEAQGQVLTLVLSPGGKLVGAVQGSGGMLAGIVKAIEEKAPPEPVAAAPVAEAPAAEAPAAAPAGEAPAAPAAGDAAPPTAP